MIMERHWNENPIKTYPFYPNHSTRQAGHKEHLWVSSVRDSHSRSHLCVDLQPEDQRETSQVDHCWSGPSAAGIEAERVTFVRLW